MRFETGIAVPFPAATLLRELPALALRKICDTVSAPDVDAGSH